MKIDLSDLDVVFFDFDGVLVDSVDIKTRAFAAMFEDYGEKFQKQVIDYHLEHGSKSRVKKFEYYYEELLDEELTDAKLESLCEKYSDHVVDGVVNAPEIPGARKILERLRDEKPCHVVSGTPHEELEKIIRRREMNDYFEDVFGAPAAKDAMIEKVLADYGHAPERTLLWGDSRGDYQAAKQSGVEFVGVINSPDESALTDLQGFETVKNFTEVDLQ